MTAFAPAITRSKELLAQKSSKVALKLVPDIQRANRPIVNSCSLCLRCWNQRTPISLVLNTVLAQDAFELTHLKLESKMISDQREAIAREIDRQSSPESLARTAVALGMKPSETPTFLNLDQLQISQEGRK